MEKITRDNYESIFIDFFDGNLSQDMKIQLDIFLAENPDLKTELDGFESSFLAPITTINFEHKSQLKKIEPVNLGEHIAAYVEGDLSESQKNLLANISAQDSSLSKEILLMSTLKLKSDASLIFEKKELLTKFSGLEQITHSNIELFLAADFEGDLSVLKKNELRKFLSENLEFKNIEKSFLNLKLNANQQILFSQKDNLYKSDKKGIVIQLQRAFAIAALLIICFGIFKFYSNKDSAEKLLSIKKMTKTPFADTAKQADTKFNSKDVDSSSIKSLKNQKLIRVVKPKESIENLEIYNTAQTNILSKNKKINSSEDDKKDLKSTATNEHSQLKPDSIIKIKSESEPSIYEQPIGVQPMEVEQYELADQHSSQKNSDDKIYSLRQFIREKLKGKVISKKGNEETNEEEVTNNFAYSVSKVTGVTVDYKKQINQEEEYLS